MAEETKRRKLNFEKCEYCRKDKQEVTGVFDTLQRQHLSVYLLTS